MVENQWEVTEGGGNMAVLELGFVWVIMKILSEESKVFCVKGASVNPGAPQKVVQVGQVVSGGGCTSAWLSAMHPGNFKWIQMKVF